MVVHGLAKRNPASDIKPSDVLASRKASNYARISAKELPELIGARWSEFDMEAARWDIPASRMKMKMPHIVPLSTQAVNVLQTLQLVSVRGGLLFPGERDHEKSMSNNTILGRLTAWATRNA